MTISQAMLGGRMQSLVQRRTLFNKLKNSGNALEKFNEKDSSFHHEYSIRPDTFAFKVSGRTQRNRTLVDGKAGPEPVQNKPSPFQKLKSNKFHPLDFIYRNSTNYPFEDRTPQEVFDSFPTSNSAKLARSKARPKKTKMTAADFIEDSLYNPHYGYFSQEVEIFHSEKPFDYNNIRDVDDFLDSWRSAYEKYDEQTPANQRKELISPDSERRADPNSKLAKASLSLYNEEKNNLGTVKHKRSLQLWHTPTELFSPYYGEALARHILTNYQLKGNYPYDDLIIYEMGGGNGTLMCNILGYIKKNEPDIYKRTQYKIIEISSQLAMKQYTSGLRSKLTKQGLDTSKFEIINRSIFDWNTTVNEPCFFIALEVFDNFAHDLIRYDIETGEPQLGHVLVDKRGDFYEFFTPELNQYSEAFLQLRENGEQSVLKNTTSAKGRLQTLKSFVPYVTDKDAIHPLYLSRAKLAATNSLLPFKDGMTPGEFIPTRLLQFFNILKHRFPNHSLVSSDFHSLPNTIGGYYNSPVVQTVLKDNMVDVTTYMVHQGYFDIMFATDFDLASDLYKQVTGKVASVESHRQFLEKWADVKATTTKKGENPMLDFYRNVSFMVS